MPGSARVSARRIFTADRSFEPLVEGVEDPGHAAFAQEAVDAVPASDQGRRARLHRGVCTPRARSPAVVRLAVGRPAVGQGWQDVGRVSRQGGHLTHDGQQVAGDSSPKSR